jgi:hypothetical protein
VWEIFLQGVGQFFVELGVYAFQERRRLHPAVSAVGLVLTGGVCGVVTSAIWPTRVFEPVLPGASLLVSPLVSGFVMEHFGRWRERRGQTRSHFATYWGGALFAFAMASVRFLWVARAG